MSQPVDPKRRALGRGLESLLPSRPAVVATIQADDSTGKPLEIPVDQVDRNPYQTRTTFDQERLKELAESIAASGVIQPIVVRASPTPNGQRYQLIMGERRLLASRLAERKTIPAIVRVVSDEQAMEMTIVENLQREDLNAIEQAKAFHRLSNEFKMTQEQMATRTGMPRSQVANYLRLLRLPELVQKRVEAGELSFGHAKLLLGLPAPEAMIAAAGKILALSMSVRQAETYVQHLLHPEERAAQEQKAAAPIDANVKEAQTRLQRVLGLRVKIEDAKGKGRVIIDYANLEDFDAILTALNAQPAE